MPANPRKATAKKAAPAATTEEPVSDLDAMRAEVAAEPGAADECYTLPLADKKVRVKHILDWPLSADALLQAKLLEQWAQRVLVEEDLPIWAEVDPTLRQFVAFMDELEAVTGVPFGLQVASPTN
jgi:hypothetical protein